jgi:hypothetical protein
MPFSQEVKSQMFHLSDRHCCLCRKKCGVNIEAHHILPETEGGPCTLDNGIPLCVDCHAEVGHYNVKHPKGNKFRAEELQATRDRIYALVAAGRPINPMIQLMLHATEVRGGDGNRGDGGNASVMAAPGQNVMMIGGAIRGGDGGANGGKGGDAGLQGGPGIKSFDALSAMEFDVLKLVGQKKRATVLDAVAGLSITVQRAQFYLDELVRSYRLLDWIANMDNRIPVCYTLTHEGRRVLVQRGEI